MKRLTAHFQGRVQGVGFRFTTVEVAKGFSITGYVQNKPDGSVELVAEGDEAEIKKFLERLHSSHIFRYVTQEQVNWSSAIGEFSSFSVRY